MGSSRGVALVGAAACAAAFLFDQHSGFANALEFRRRFSASSAASSHVTQTPSNSSTPATSSNATTSAAGAPEQTSLPTLSALSASLDALQLKLNGFNLQIDSLAQNLTTLENSTSVGLSELANLQTSFRNVYREAVNSSAVIANLTATANVAAAVAANNSVNLKNEEQQLSVLSGNVLQLGSSQLDTAAKIARLEQAVNETVPTGKLSTAMDAIGKRLDAFEAKLQSGVAKEAEAYLKEGVEKMRAEIRKAAAGAGGSTRRRWRNLPADRGFGQETWKWNTKKRKPKGLPEHKNQGQLTT
eukprot:g7898.t1